MEVFSKGTLRHKLMANHNMLAGGRLGVFCWLDCTCTIKSGFSSIAPAAFLGSVQEP